MIVNREFFIPILVDYTLELLTISVYEPPEGYFDWFITDRKQITCSLLSIFVYSGGRTDSV